jgi:rubredoxin
MPRFRLFQQPTGENDMNTWMCVVCGFIYDEARGDPDSGVPPGTAWADVPEDWRCPECGVGKADVVMCPV